jgi:cell division protein FtsQ
MAVQEIRENGFGLGSGVAPARRGVRSGVGRGKAEPEDDVEETKPRTRRAGFGSGIRLRVRAGLVPASTRGRVFGGVALLCIVGAMAAVVEAGRRALIHDERFVVPSSSSIQIEGNRHLTRAQLLSVFGADVEQNVLTVPLAERRADLQRLPWVEHATVMRLLPNRLRVSVVERTPVAFVRQGRHIGLVDSHGVLLDMGDGESQEKYSFPVVTGINAEDPLSVRAARMKIFLRFAKDLDGSGEKILNTLSEVDLSNPEDVKALIPDHATDLLVHFGDTDFLERYRKFEEQLPGWRQQYPKLASADMRYERQVVLEMQPGTAVPVSEGTAEATKKPVVQAAKGKPLANLKLVAKNMPAKRASAAAQAKSAAPHGASTKAISEYGKPHFPGAEGSSTGRPNGSSGVKE